MRLLTKTLAVVSILVPTSGHTLGIGEIKLHSALNQNLDAEISLALSGESISDIKVSLAPPEKFDKAGVAWSYFLSKIKFQTITHANGSTVIKLTSNEALKEPFLDFLLEVSWPKGNLYREFTVLVDPPSVYVPATVPASTISERYSSSQVAAPQHETYAGGQIIKDEYGPTLSTDTLWNIAERARVQDVSVEQMMVAIYEANPDAFYKGNVYALTAGKTLRIPERESVIKISRSQALAEFNRHTKAWKAHAAPVPVELAKQKTVQSKVDESVARKEERSVDNQLKLVAPAKAAIEGQAVLGDQVAAEKKSGKASVVTPEIVKGKPVLAETEVAESGASSPEGSIQNRVVELEKQLALMQKMIALKDQQLATFQEQLKASSAVQGQAPTPKVVNPVEQVPPVTKQAVEPPVGSAQPVTPVTVVTVVEPKADDLYYWGVGGAGMVILSLLGLLWLRKRKVDEQMNTESMFASSTMINVPESFAKAESKSDVNIIEPVVEDVGMAHGTGTVGESSFLSEFTPSDFDSFDTDQGEIDPISEADVYLAYGRYQQAEELIRQAIKDQPKRDECKLKLLEIFYANEDKEAFEAYVSELASSGKREDVVFWGKVAEMGSEICPDSPLFSSKGEYPVGEQQNNQDIDFNLSSFSMEKGEAEQDVITSGTHASKSSEAQTEEIDFDLSSFSMEKGEAEQDVKSSGTQAGKSSEAQIEEIDFDLSSFSMDFKEVDEVSNAPTKSESPLDKLKEINTVNEEKELESFDFDFSSNGAETTSINDFDFSDIENIDKTDQDLDLSDEKSLDMSDDFDFNFEMPLSADGKGLNKQVDFGVSDLTDMDELETKLDLAKAYVDMGDADAAKDLAREVLEQGTDEQKKSAQSLLDELG